MTRIDDLPALAALPSARALTMTDGLREAFARERPGIWVGRALHRSASAGLLLPGMRAWALTLSEVACARLPGGELVPDGDGVVFLPGVVAGGADSHDRTCRCGDYRNHRAQRWLGLINDTMYACRDRDGARLFELIEQALVRPDSPDDMRSYLGSLASSSCTASAEAGLDRPRDALLHALAYHANTPEHWSTAGPLYRMCSATLTVADIGPEFGPHVIDPELAGVAGLGAHGRLRALAVMGPAVAELLADDPVEPVTSVELDDVEDINPLHEQMIDTAVRFALAYRRLPVPHTTAAARDELADLVEQVGHGGVALAVIGLTNMLAMRIRDLYA